MSDKVSIIIDVQNAQKAQEALRNLGIHTKTMGDEVKKASTQATMFSGALSKLVAGLGVYVSFRVAARAIKDVIQASSEQELVFKKLSVAVENTGGSFKKSRGEIENFLDTMQKTTVYGDTETAKLLQDLLPYTNNLSDAMRGAKIAMDMASAGLFDINTASKYVGMAMQGNVEMLGRYIGELRSSGNEQLKNMTAIEKTEYALNLLQKKYGGMASNELNTFAGATKQLNNYFGDLKEAVGDYITTNRTLRVTIQNATFLINELTQSIKSNQSAWENLSLEEIPLDAIRDKIAGLTKELSSIDERRANWDIQYEEKISKLKQEIEYYAKLLNVARRAQEEITKGEEESIKEKSELLLNYSTFRQELNKENFIFDEELRQAGIEAELTALEIKRDAVFSVAQSTASIMSSAARMTGQSWLDAVAILITGIAQVAKIVSTFKAIIAPTPWQKAAAIMEGIAVVAGTVTALASIAEQKKKLTEITVGDLSDALPKAASGMDYVPADMPIMVHKGERIVPANENPYNPSSTYTSSAGVVFSNTFNISAIIRETADIDLIVEKIGQRLERDVLQARTLT